MLTKPQIDALKLFPVGSLLTTGRFANICAELAKKGLVKFEGYKSGKRAFSITENGIKEILES